MEKVRITGAPVGDIRPLHGVNCAPYSCMDGKEQPRVQRLFGLAHIPFSRLHDVMGAYGGSYYVDIPNIFRDFSLDENNPDSYDFYYTDEYIGAIVAAGAQVVYRLGITIEWGSHKYRAVPPADNEKWARICEHIVAHYNEGWAEGFHYGIRYWEIWNEPENPPMWSGSRQQFFSLYSTASRHLKKVYPQLMIGGYGSCGFYAVTDPGRGAFYQSFVSYFTDFLTMCRDEHCPLDFFSWHLYSDSCSQLLSHAAYVRRTLDRFGFRATESHLNEWNYGSENRDFTDKHTAVGASFLAAALIDMQKSGLVDKAMYYVFSANAMYDGFLNQNDLSIDPPYWSFVAYGDLWIRGTEVQTECSEGIRALAAVGGKEGGLLLTNYSAEPCSVQLLGAPVFRLCRLDETLPAARGDELNDKMLELPPFGTAYLKFDLT